VGGPLRRDKTFFFGDYERFWQRQGVTSLITLPTARMRSGDFSELPITIYDSLTTPRTPFSDNTIPADRLSPVALRYLALLPQNTHRGSVNNYGSTMVRTQSGSTADVRVDHRFNGNNQFFARYSYNNVHTFTPSACPATSDGIDPGCTGGPAFPGPNNTIAHGSQANFVRVFNSSMVSEIKGGYLRSSIESLPLNYGSNASERFGLAGVNVDAVTSGLALMTLTGYSSLGDSVFIPLIQVDTVWQANVMLTKTRGPHNIKVGGGYIARQFTVFQSASPVGNFTFDTKLTDNGAGVGGNSIASFLLGYPSEVTRSHSLVYPYYHTNEPNAFVQDDWHVSSSVTINLGVRYDVFTPLTEEDDRLTNFDVRTGRLLVAGRDGVSRSGNVKTDYSNVAPRLGFSASLPRAMVFRGGYGLTYYPGNSQSGALMKNAPFVSSYGPVISNGTTGGQPSVFLSDGLPPVVATDQANPSGGIVAVAENFRSTRVQQFNVAVEKEFAGTLVSAGYVGSRGHLVPQAGGAAGPDINLAPVGAGPVQPRRTYSALAPGLTTISLLQSTFNTYYNALHLVFQRRYRAGISVNSSYTLGRNEWTGAAPWNAQIVERYDADNDVRHRVSLLVIYELPFARGEKGTVARLASGWQVTAVATWQTGTPFNITNATARSNTGGADRPNMVGDPTIANPTPQRWFNTAAFEAQPVNTIGAAVVPANVLHGPRQRRVDLSLGKHVAVGGAARLQFRIEAYNLLNTVNFANPNAALGDPAFGTIASTNGTPRQMQFAVKLLF
jgi:hypothetical protein